MLPRLALFLAATAAVAQQPRADRAVSTPWSYAHARLKPVDMRAVRITGGLWKDRVGTNIERGWFDLDRKFDERGYFTPFRTIAEGRDAAAGGKTPNNDEFVYKWMEAGGLYAGYPGGGAACDRIRARLDEAAAMVLAIQKPDGYINSYFGNRRVAREVHPPFHPENRFEFYNFGHLAQAAVALYRNTGERKLLDGTLRFADLIVRQFGAPRRLPYRLNRGPINLRNEHPNHELAMVELYRATGDKRFLDFAAQTLDEYNYCSRWQIDGHAVQETLLNAGAVDVYLETGEKRFLDASARLWNDMVEGRVYPTGGIGSRRAGESFGARYELPDEAYAETCAAIGSFFWSYRLLLATGEGKYGDLMERLMHNGVLSGLSLSGTEYFYTNPMAGSAPRRPWFQTACCPPNLSRFLAALGGFYYATAPDGVSVLLYGPSEAEVAVNGRKLGLRQETRYPWEGAVRITVEPEAPAAMTLRLRIPSWTHGRPVASDLYRYLDEAAAPVEARVNGAPVSAKVENGFLAISRTWNAGDVVDLALPMPVRRLAAHESVLHLRGRAALERGPVVYCVEGVDNGVVVVRLTLPDAAPLRAEFVPGLLGGVTVIRGEGLQAIPYAVWANRGESRMAVWLPRR